MSMQQAVAATHNGDVLTALTAGCARSLVVGFLGSGNSLGKAAVNTNAAQRCAGPVLCVLHVHANQ
jgi:hypothetical protein